MDKKYLKNGKIMCDWLFFHGLKFSNEDDNYDLKILDSILKNGEIATKDRLKQILAEEEIRKLWYSKSDLNWNGNDRVSIARDRYHDRDVRGIAYSDRAFPLYCLHNISIIIDPNILMEMRWYSSACRNGPDCVMNGEVQIKGSIPKKYFLGITMPAKILESTISEIMTQHNYLEYKVINDLINLSDDEFFLKYFDKQLLIEKIIQQNGYDLDIFDIDSGYKLNSSEAGMEKIKVYKKQIINKI